MNLTNKANQITAKFAEDFNCKFAIDATCGNGFDTLHLAKSLSKSSKIFAFDVQKSALLNSQKLLAENGLQDCVQFINKSHEFMQSEVPSEFLGKINIAMFNLGWLPRSDKSVITKPSSTIAALKSLDVLMDKSCNLISVLSYKAHDGGLDEFYAVNEYLKDFTPDIFTDAANPMSPTLFVYSLK